LQGWVAPLPLVVELIAHYYSTAHLLSSSLESG